MGKFKDCLKWLLCNPMFWVAVIYLLVPVDFLPDAIPVVGTIDDLILLLLTEVAQAAVISRKDRR